MFQSTFNIGRARWLLAVIGCLPCVLLLLISTPVFSSHSFIEFNHDDTSFPLDFTHALVGCESCHVQGVFLGTPNQCSGCHSEGSRIQARAPSIRHIRTTNECELCHRTGIWEDVFRVDHIAINGNCFNCHNGVIAEGKNPGHISSSNNCDDCHQTISWKGAGFDHTNVTGSCFNCHNGVIATGKVSDHIASTNNCADCHQTSGWLPITHFNHNSVTGTCFSCHNGIIAVTKNPGHIVSSDQCELCHAPQGWIPANSP